MNLSDKDREQLRWTVAELAKQGASFAEIEKFEASSICLVGSALAMLLTCVNDTLEEIRDAINGIEIKATLEPR